MVETAVLIRVRVNLDSGGGIIGTYTLIYFLGGAEILLDRRGAARWLLCAMSARVKAPNWRGV